jgi:hypothetical protein
MTRGSLTVFLTFLVALAGALMVSAQALDLATDKVDAEQALTAELAIAHEALPPLKQVGTSTLRVAFFKVFDSALFTESGEWRDPRTSFRYELTYARSISGNFLVSQTTKEWDHLGFQDSRRSRWVESLEAIWPDVNKGDTIAFDVDAKGVSRFYFNGVWVGTINDPDFAPSFIAIWLSPDTSRPAHRDGLLADS